MANNRRLKVALQASGKVIWWRWSQDERSWRQLSQGMELAISEENKVSSDFTKPPTSHGAAKTFQAMYLVDCFALSISWWSYWLVMISGVWEIFMFILLSDYNIRKHDLKNRLICSCISIFTLTSLYFRINRLMQQLKLAWIPWCYLSCFGATSTRSTHYQNYLYLALP